MDNRLKPISTEVFAISNPAASAPLTFTQTGDNATQVGHADTVNAYLNVNVVAPTILPDGTIADGRALSREYYNVFVVSGGVLKRLQVASSYESRAMEYPIRTSGIDLFINRDGQREPDVPIALRMRTPIGKLLQIK